MPIVLSPAIAEALRNWDIPSLAEPDEGEIASRCLAVSELPLERRPAPAFALAFDGSNQEVEAKAGYPSIRVGFFQIAGVYLDIPRFLSASNDGLLDVRELERAQVTQTVNSVLPGSNVFVGGASGSGSLRIELERAFTSSRITDFGPPFSLADALLTIHGAPGSPVSSIKLSKCPVCGSAGIGEGNYVGIGESYCNGPLCGSPLYVTDVLRIYEEFAEDSSNVLTLTRAMNIAERLLLVSYLDGFYRTSRKSLSNGLFITDGPLAVYGPIAPMKSRLASYWEQLCAGLDREDLAPPLLVGIEKTGRFVDHAHAIRQAIPPGHVMVLDTPYVNRHIVNQAEDHFYGKDEFYGRRFFYRTNTGEILVVTVPRVPGGPPYEKPVSDGAYGFASQPSELWESYPTLRATLESLDSLQTRLYPDAVIPVALAHSASSLPLGTGRSVLTLLAQQNLGMPQDSVSVSRFQFTRPRA
ncbi:hypothetical protein [Paractinoplanes hotanensis]|uniref:NurA domain-containing protein n=1 Tax=Paractinoplanes hotanensis TaxID=2906497 RepID=A0ABT0YI10_9ACTN|nr:hypothetical protein [Actinoplanes hotanensis]MCM4085158.1 hypothetical protein [Actinoplanes hotanensis]